MVVNKEVLETVSGLIVDQVKEVTNLDIGNGAKILAIRIGTDFMQAFINTAKFNKNGGSLTSGEVKNMNDKCDKLLEHIHSRVLVKTAQRAEKVEFDIKDILPAS